MTADYDYIVVGLGGLGSAAAYWLSRTGKRVLGLEQFELGHERGASQDHSRVVRLSYHRADYIELARSAYDAWAAVERESGERLVTKTGGLHLAPVGTKEPILDDHLTSLETCGVPFEVLDSAEVMRRWPQWALKEDVQAIFQADSGVIAAATANAAHRRLAQAHGAHLLDRTPVTSIRSVGGEVEVICGATAYRASRVILTTDAWTNQLLAPLGLSLPLVITQEQSVYFKPADPGAFVPERYPIWIWADLPRFYGLPSLGDSGPKLGEDVGGREVTTETRTFDVDQAALGRVLDFARTHFASGLRQVANVKPCLYTMPPDRDFIIDALPDNPHVFIGLGAAHAFKFASQIGRVLTDLATRGETSADIARFRFGRDVLKTKDARTDYRI